jgi:hypothetical protein
MADKVQEQWEELIDIINVNISSPRKEKLINMYERYAEKICTAPASSHTSRHNCFPGGYIDHVIRVVRCAENLYDVWLKLGTDMSNFTKEELIFSALNHDLGKIGSSTEDYYIPNDSKWHIERGQTYKINAKLNYMKVPDRSVYTLQENNIPISENEFLAIKLHDGLYAKGNESYYMGSGPEFALKTHIPILLHHADHLATLIEGNLHHEETIKVKVSKPKLNTVSNSESEESLKSAFDQIFGTFDK